MCEPSLRQQVVGFHCRFEVLFVDAHSDSHQHVLGSFYHATIHSQEVGAFERFEAEIIVIKITIVDDFRVQTFSVVHDDLEDVFGDERSGVVGLGVDMAVHDLDAAITTN